MELMRLWGKSDGVCRECVLLWPAQEWCRRWAWFQLQLIKWASISYYSTKAPSAMYIIKYINGTIIECNCVHIQYLIQKCDDFISLDFSIGFYRFFVHFSNMMRRFYQFFIQFGLLSLNLVGSRFFTSFQNETEILKKKMFWKLLV